MEKEQPISLWERIKPIGVHALVVCLHTIVLLLILGSIWVIRKALEYLLGQDPMLFKVFPLKHITDAAELLALLKFLWIVIREFGGKR